MPNANKSQDTEPLLDLLGRQRDLYMRLRALAEQQRSLISSDRPEQLLNILRERQTLVGALARLNEELGPFRRNWDEVYRDLPAEQRRRANRLLQQINELLRVILLTDQEDSALLSARKQSLGQRIRGVADGRSANSAYARQSGKRPARPAADVTG